MQIKIVGSSSPHYWYANRIGDVYNVIHYYKQDNMFLVRDYEGHLNIVHKDAAQVVSTEGLNDNDY